jgi:5'-3' exonuclease
MIIVDFSGIATANIFVQQSHNELNEDYLRMTILNTLCKYNVKFRNKYGQMIIACDNKSWRKGVFEYYKAKRAGVRDKSDIDWPVVYGWLDQLKSDLQEYSPFSVIECPGAEADDIIGVLVESTQDFGQFEEVMIVSADKDFLQLQKYKNVHQYSNLLRKEMITDDAQFYLFEHICKGDSADGIPNIFSDDDTFIVEGKRQNPCSHKKIVRLYEAASASGKPPFEKEVHYRNFMRNRQLVDLTAVPDDVRDKILEQISICRKSTNSINKNKFLNYLIKKRCNTMIDRFPDFF